MNGEYQLTTSVLHHYTPLHFLQVSDPKQAMQKNQSEHLDELH